MKPKVEVSVIIAAYNEGKHIGASLESMLNQTHPAYEVIVVDDGSTDRTAEIVKKYPVKLFQQEHSGPAKARNLGASRATGEILVIADADMTFDEQYLEKSIVPLKESKAIASWTRGEYVKNIENPLAKCWNIKSGLPSNLRILPDCPDEILPFRAIFREAFLQVGGFDNVGYADDHTVLQKLGKKAVNAPGAICYHNNPDTLKEAFYSARWFGRGEMTKFTLSEIFYHSPPYSFLHGIKQAIRHKMLLYPIFNLVYDTGMLIGMVQRKIYPKKHFM